MISTLKGLSYKLIKNNKFTFFSSIFSIMIAVMLIISMFMFTINLKENMSNNLRDIYGDVDISVGVDDIYSDKLDKNKMNKLYNLDGIDKYAPIILGNLQIGDLNLNTYSIGVDNSELSKSRYKYETNIKENQIILDKNLSNSLKVSIGDSVKVNNNNLKVIDIYEGENLTDTSPNIAFININTMKSIIGDSGEATYILFKLKDEVNAQEFVKKAKSIDNSLKIDIMMEEGDAVDSLKLMNNFMFIVSILTIIMSCLFIISNFQTFLSSYRKQFSLIRALGGSSKQAFKIVFIQCTYINAIGVILGLLGSYIANNYLVKILESLMEVESINIRYFILPGVLISILAFIIIEIFMLIPAIRGSKILPLKVTQDEKIYGSKSKFKKSIGIFGVILSIILFIFQIIEASIFFGLASSIVLISSVYMLFNYYIKEILNFFSPIFRLISGKSALVAMRSVAYQIKSSRLIVLSLSTMIIISIFGETFFNTIERRQEVYIRQEVITDILVIDSQEVSSNLDITIEEDLKKISGVKNISIFSNYSSLYCEIKGGVEDANFQMANIDSLVKEGLIPNYDGDVKKAVYVSNSFAEENNVSLGDRVKLKSGSDKEGNIISKSITDRYEEYTISGIMEDGKFSFTDLLIDWNDNYSENATYISRITIASNDIEATLSGLSEFKRDNPSIKYATLDELIEKESDNLKHLWVIFIIVLIVILFSIVLGILNMLVNNISGKRKEYAILRALKLSRLDIVKLILSQILIYILLGLILGGSLGFAVSNIIKDGDYSNIYVSNKLMLGISSLLIGACLLIFIPFSMKVSKKQVSSEIKYEER